MTKASRTAAIFSCCERGSFDAASNNRRILPVGPTPVHFFSVLPDNSSTETPNASAIGGAHPRRNVARLAFIERERALWNAECLGQFRP